MFDFNLRKSAVNLYNNIKNYFKINEKERINLIEKYI